MKIQIDKYSMIPIYEQIANELRDGIYNGELQNGDRIDSEPKMCLKLNVSRGTVRKAINILIKEGQLTKIRGKGTFVTNPNVAYPLNSQLFSVAETLEAQHIMFTTQVIQQKILKANRETAKGLNIPLESKYLYLERIRLVENEPLMLIENRINFNLCPGLENENLNNVSLFTKIEKFSKRKINFASSTYEALSVGRERGKLLDLPAKSPILKMQQTVFMSQNEPIEYGSVWLKGNKYFLTTTLQRR